MAFEIAELNVKYSNFVKDYLNKGFVISPINNSSNTYGALTFLDLVNPKEKE